MEAILEHADLFSWAEAANPQAVLLHNDFNVSSECDILAGSLVRFGAGVGADRHSKAEGEAASCFFGELSVTATGRSGRPFCGGLWLPPSGPVDRQVVLRPGE